jgi:hypothetical protein
MHLIRRVLATVGVVATIVGCHSSSLTKLVSANPRIIVLNSSFDSVGDLIRWQVDVPNSAPSVRHVVSNEIRGVELAVHGAESLGLRRQVDAHALRGQRIRLTARVKTRKAFALAALHVRRTTGEVRIGDVAESRETANSNWTVLYAVLDVANDASEIEVRLGARGDGEVLVDEVRVVSIGRPSSASVTGSSLSSAQRRALVALGQILALVRYFHPADEGAVADWDSLTVLAVSRVLAMRNESLSEVLNELLSPIAPLTEVYRAGDRPRSMAPFSRGEEPTTWWHHSGLGPEGYAYLNFRVGIDEPETAGLAFAEVPADAFAKCRRATVTLKTEKLDAPMSAHLEMRLVRRGDREESSREKLLGVGLMTRLTRNLPEDVVRIQVGLRGSGHGAAASSGLTFECSGRRPVVLDLRSAVAAVKDVFELGQSLYEAGVSTCAAGACIYVNRKTSEPSDRWIDVPVGAGLRLHMPVVLTRREGRTLPVAAGHFSNTPTNSVWDRATRIAAVLVAWGTLQHFYPYFEEVRVDWSRELEPALDAAAASRSPAETYTALSRLIARLGDGHGYVNHPGQPRTGIAALAIRRIEGSLLVTGGLQAYLTWVPIGSEVLSLDGVPATRAYARMASEVSAATDGYRRYRAPLLLTRGPVSTWRRLEVRGSDERTRELAVPLVSRDKMEEQIREPRPRNGTELAPGVFYFDIETLEAETWQPLISDLAKARAIVFDMRGYPGSGAWVDVISHLTDEEVTSPIWDVPIVQATGVIGYDRTWWTIRPNAPRFRAKIVFLTDGRAVSAAETVLQMIRDHRLGVLVGEPTAGTNGNITSFTVPGSFQIYFTGMRVLNESGELIHGRGIAPDYVVHPTLAGVRAGRDEILETALRVIAAKQ